MTRVEASLEELGISPELCASRGLQVCDEARELVVAEVGEDGREYLLIPAAAEAWHRLRDAARSDGVIIQIASAFRSVERQTEIIRRKLARGLSLETILAVSAPPGYSEHHTGRAVDVATPGSPPLELVFEGTEAFRWLTDNAASFRYTMSYPRENACGYVFEPWHWCYRKDEVKAEG